MTKEVMIKFYDGMRFEEFERYANGPHPEGPQPDWQEWVVVNVDYYPMSDLTEVTYFKS